ncbi:MAG: DUF1587 domain-containing protein [Lentisphaeraceae bacterium]|nr:DUF1587 domain-containing protein [Lentisphaeraceae bacterium]
MFRLTVLCFFLAVLSTAFATEKSIHIDEKYRSFMNSYCLDCHNAKRKKGKVRFDKEGFSFEIKTIQDADLWQKVLTAINAKEMPPEDEDQPKDAEKVEFLEMLSGKMVEARDFFKDTGGKTLMRRLNRREYANTLKQLIGVDVDVSSLPEDHSPYGFDTNGGSLFMSSDQIEQYMKIARTGLKKALTAPVKIQKVRLEPELTATPELQERANKYVSKYEGGLAFDKSKDKNKDPKDYGLVDARDAFTSKNEYKKFYGAVKYYLDHPLTKTGFLLGLNRHNQNQTFTMPRPGIYKIRARVGKTKNAPDDRSFLDLGFFDGSQKAFYREDSFHVTKSVQEGQIIESVIEVKDKKVLSFRERQRPRSAAKIYRAYNHKHGRGLDGALWIDWVEWEGPFPQNKSTLIKSVVGTLSKESTNSQVRDLIEGFTKSTFRNSEVSRDYLNGLLGVYKTELKLSGDPQKAIIEPLAMVLSSPSFIYLSEPVKENSSKKVDQRELAVRLAFFLWSTAPDSE